VVRWRSSKGRSEPPSAYRPSGFTIVTVTPDNLQWAEDVGSSLCDALRPAEPAPLPPSLGWRGPPLRGPARSSWPRTSLSRSRPAKCPGMVVNQTAAIEGLVRRETESETVQISSCRHAHGPRRSSMRCGGSARAVPARVHVLRGVVVRAPYAKTYARRSCGGCCAEAGRVRKSSGANIRTGGAARRCSSRARRWCFPCTSPPASVGEYGVKTVQHRRQPEPAHEAQCSVQFLFLLYFFFFC
jgi:hypothetical protein